MDNKRKRDGDESHSTKKAKLVFCDKKTRKTIRQRMKKKHFDLSKKLKLLWGEIRCKKTENTKKLFLLAEASALIKGHAFDLTFAHDTVRVIECVVTLGNEDQRSELFEELKEFIISLATSKYSKFLLLRMLEFGTKEQKEYILKQFCGKIVKLIHHAEASAVIEMVFNKHANAFQKGEMLQEFYGPSFKFFKDIDCSCLADILRKKSDNVVGIMDHLQKTIESAITKFAHKYNIIHHVLFEYMENCDNKQQSEMIGQLKKYVVEILHTKMGSAVAMKCLWYGTAKDRKVIMKNFKSHVAKIAQEEFGHMVLLALFDCVDDTTSVDRYIIQEIAKNANAICQNVHGKKVLLYLVSPRNSSYIHPYLVETLKHGDSNATSKKPQKLRQTELHNAAAPMLIKVIVDNLSDKWTDHSFCLFAALVLTTIKVDCEDVFLCIAKLAVHKEYTASSAECDKHFIEELSSNLLLKKLILSDEEKMFNQHTTFADVLLKVAPPGTLGSWIHCNRGCYLLINLLEIKREVTFMRVREEVLSNEHCLNSKTYSGAHILASLALGKRHLDR